MKSCPQCQREYDDGVEKCLVDTSTLTKVENDPLVGTILADRYEIVSVIGKGGMGVVYKVRQDVMDRFMAIKMLHSHMVAEPEAVKRFFREAKTISQVKHHHVVTLYDFGMSTKGQPYIVMDYLEGKSLKHVSDAKEQITFERADHIFKQVIEGLSAAHALDVVHRDLKPENIMLTKQTNVSDWVTLVDFGLSKLKDARGSEIFSITRIGDVCGSPPYMSPEQCLSSRVVDSRSDIYGLAVVIYEALSNQLPFESKSAIEMLDCHLYGVPKPFKLANPDFKVCTELTHVFDKALEKDPEKRHQTVEEFGMELHEALMRDSLKLRTLRHRAAQASLHAPTRSNGEEDANSSSKAIIASEIINDRQFLREQARLEADYHASEPNLATGLKPQQEPFFAPKPRAEVKSTPHIGIASNREEQWHHASRQFDECRYCGAPVQGDLKLCLGCGRQVLSHQEDSMLGIVQGRHGSTRARRNLESEARASIRAKLSDERTRRLVKIQQVLKIVLLLLIVYGSFLLLRNHTALQAIEKVIAPYLHR